MWSFQLLKALKEAYFKKEDPSKSSPSLVPRSVQLISITCGNDAGYRAQHTNTALLRRRENHQYPSVHTLPDTRCFSESMIFVTGLRWTVKVWKSWGPDPTVSGCCTITLTAPELVPYAISIQLPLTPTTSKSTVVPPGIKARLFGGQGRRQQKTVFPSFHSKKAMFFKHSLFSYKHFATKMTSGLFDSTLHASTVS